MDKLRVEGGKRLEGSITISGAKNAALPLMAASLMAETEMVLENLPELADTASMLALLNHLEKPALKKLFHSELMHKCFLIYQMNNLQASQN